MLQKGRAKKLTIFTNEAEHWHGRPLYEALIDLLLAKGLAGGTVVRAIAGFTRGGGVVNSKLLRLSENLPLRVEVVDTAEAIESVIPDVYLMVGRGLVTVEDVDVVKYSGSPGPESGTPAVKRVTMKAKQLRIHISDRDDHYGEPLHEAIVKRFNAEEFAGLTVYRGLEGFGAHHEIHRNGLLSHKDAPIVMVMIDTAEHVERARSILDSMLTHGAVVVSDVEVTFYGTSAEDKEEAPGEPSSSA